MARGLSEQQRRILTAAYAAYRNAAERNQRAESNARYLANYRKPDQWRGPNVPIPHITRSDALLALHGWRGGVQERDWWQRVRHIPSATLTVFSGFGRVSSRDTVVGTVSRAEYEVVQASLSRALTRLVARGLLGPHGYYVGYDLTEAGIHAGAQLAAQLATGQAEGDREGA